MRRDSGFEVLTAFIIRAMMEATSTSETSVNFYQTTRHRLENLKCHRQNGYVHWTAKDGGRGEKEVVTWLKVLFRNSPVAIEEGDRMKLPPRLEVRTFASGADLLSTSYRIMPLWIWVAHKADPLLKWSLKILFRSVCARSYRSHSAFHTGLILTQSLKSIWNESDFLHFTTFRWALSVASGKWKATLCYNSISVHNVKCII
jgi:hypothetical protein